MKVDLLKQIVGDKFFSVEFIKKNGELRKMTCRLGVKKHLKGGEKTYTPEDLNMLTVFDVQKKQYRTVNVNTLMKVKFKGVDLYTRMINE